MTYQPDLRDDSWTGHKGHSHARPHDLNATKAFNDRIKDEEREKARKSAEAAKQKRSKQLVS